MAVPNTQPKLPKESINVGNHPLRRPFFFANLLIICAIAVTCLSFMLMTDFDSGDGGVVTATGVEAAGEENVLAKHVAFFDMNNDGIVYPWETFKGFRAIGCGLPLSAFAAVFINLVFSQKTRPGKFPSIRLPIEIKNIAKAKHGSDSGVYDSAGRFVPSRFEEIFKKHAKTTPDALNGEELKELLQANREPKDYAGWLLGYTEWKILYVLCKDKNGLLHKDTVRGVYDGSLFEKMAKEKASTQKKSSKTHG